MTEIAAPSPAGGSAALSRKYWDRRDRKSALRFTVSIALAMAWVVFNIWLSLPWLSDLGNLSHPIVALFVLAFVAYVPGFMNAFLLFSLVFRPDPLRRTSAHWPSLSILIAAYNEEALIGETLRSLSELEYPGKLQIMVLDDGSTDGTADAVHAQEALFGGHPRMELQLVSERKNRGKARVLNHGLELASHDLIVTIDADTLLEKGCLVSLVEHLHASPPETKAVAGSVLVANHDESWVTRAQQWDYFHGIAAVKRMQGMYNGTLVAQGAFSIYHKDALIEAGGWPDTVGEDIVLTWSLLRKGYKTGHAEDAVAWTHAPETFKGLAKQRKRWARGMIEALAIHKPLLKMRKLRTMFIWWNLLFVSIDLTFTFAFIPGLILAFLGIYWLAGPITLLVLPLAALWNIVIYRIQTRMLKRNDIEMEKSLPGFLLYAFIYPLLMQPVSVWGYFAELFGGRKQWN
ncbi:glycosyltransferase [Qipengyuania sp. XHP0211]|uniref:glycosyltransferase n=1 Tax=Qipengyuania sp. XHP0211 TaxID=3038079 RepID=UPI00241CD2F2|nr:glycosyltransferase [Qipengyuania sp. XHP0211]MDG5750854.1 glycosyltransferase [Qipengyuania sp. XHP0211]